MASLVVLLVLLFLGFGVAVWMNGRVSRREALGRPPMNRLVDPPLPPQAEDFLRGLDEQLDLPAEVRAEIRAEMTDHLQDSIAAIEAESRDRDRAAAEAVARLGRPEELARELRRAHQSTRRLLAGAAGGVFQTGVGFVGGWFVGASLLVLGLIAGTLLVDYVLKQPIDFVAAHLPRFSTDSNDLATNTAYVTFALWVAAWIAARRGVRAFSHGSRRPIQSIASWWAVAGGLVLAFLVLFVVTAQQSWLTVVGELAIPVAFAAGALVRVETGFRIPGARGIVTVMIFSIVVLPVMGLVVFGLGTSSGTEVSGQALEITPLMREWDRVAPAWESNKPLTQTDSSVGCCSNIVTLNVEFDSAFTAQFQNVRFEVWRAIPWSGASGWIQPYTVDPAYSSPFATQAADVSDGSLAGRFDLGHVKTTRWLVFLTGTGPDGHRYRLLMFPDEAGSTFSGTVWDWLTAGS